MVFGIIFLSSVPWKCRNQSWHFFPFKTIANKSSDLFKILYIRNITFKIEKNIVSLPKPYGAVGVDLGVKTLATLSNGKVFSGSKPYKTYKWKLKIEQRKLNKKYKKDVKEQSKNYKKQLLVISKLHNKIANIRKDDIHKLTTYLTKNHSEIVIEDLNVKGMSKNHKLASAILDGGFFEFRRQLEYKSKWYGSKVTIVDRFFASSKLCSCCGNKKEELKLSERTYKCDKCGFTADRDYNASLNLEKNAVSYTAYASGESNKFNESNFREDSMKQVGNIKSKHENV